MILEWLARYLEHRLPRRDSWTLTQSSIYILPTRGGWAFAATLVVMLLASINYQLNLGYALTFLLCGVGLAAMVQTHANLRGLTLRTRPPAPVFADEPAGVEVVLDNVGAERYGIGVGVHRAGNTDLAWVDVPAQGSATARLSFVTGRRGRHVLPTIQAETLYPLGLFRAWTVWRPAAEVVVYPRPERPPQALPSLTPTSGGTRSSRSAGGVEFEGVRAYRRGDSLRQVVWKKLARSHEMVSREASTGASQQLWLPLPPGSAGELEARLSRLTAWVLAADRQGLAYGLRLPGQELPCGSGESQRRAALHMLACWPDGTAQ